MPSHSKLGPAEFGHGFEGFRKEVSDFFASETKPEWFSLDPESDEYRAFGQEMDRKLIERGWFTMHWPQQYGGSGASPFQYGVLRELAGYHRVPTAGGHGRYIIGPALSAFGSEAQKLRYMPRISRGEMVICLGFTEPNAGSDLAALQTKALRDGDHFVVSGSKLYITFGHFADTMLLVARTDPSASRYKGCSLFLVDLKLPGISINKMESMGGHRITETNFNEVRVPTDCLIGEEGQGFYHMALALNYERAGVDRPAIYMAHLEELAEYCRANGLWERPAVRQRIGRLASMLHAWRMIGWRVIALQAEGKMPTWEASMSQFYRKEINPLFGQAVFEILGPRALLERGDPDAILHGRSEWYLREAFDNHGQGGRFVTRNVLARRGLSLPKERRP
jgi:alkylation response protein AidB-like acyl-CoA dehydrogenase